MKRSGILLALILFFQFLFVSLPGPSRADRGSEGALGREIEEIRKENKDLKARVEKLEAEEEEKGYKLGLFSGRVKISGYADTEYIITDEESENDGFRLHHFSLFFTADVHRQWRFFSEVEFEDAPFIEAKRTSDDPKVVQGEFFVEQLFIEYHPSLNWNLRFGRLLTPIGIWNIFHYPPYVPTQRWPLMVRRLFPETSDGVQFRYSRELFGYRLDSHFYLANGTGNPGGLDRNENKAVGLRLNYSLDLFNGFDIGASYYRDKDNSDVTRNTFAAHMLLNYSNLEMQAEFADRNNSPRGSPGFNDRSFYVQLLYDIGRWTVAGRYDWLDEDDTLPDNEHTRYTAALNYHFAYNVVTKAEYNRNEFNDPAKSDFNEVILSIVLALGDL